MGNVPPRRVVSAPTTIKVNPAATGDVWTTVMGRAAQATSGWSIDPGLPTARGFKWFECDETNRGTGRHLSDWEYHPVASGAPNPVTGEPVYGKCDYTTDGFRTAGGSENFHTAVNWTGQAVYDPVRKRVQYMTKGTGSGKGEWVFNMLAIYRLGFNEQEGWKAIRGFRATTPFDADNPDAPPMTHFFYNNCIDVVGRRHYKKQFQTTTSSGAVGPSGPWFAFNLDTEQWEPSILAPSWDPWGGGNGPSDFIATRGSRGRIWYSNDGPTPRIAEYDVATGTGQRVDWLEIVPSGVLKKMPSSYNMNTSMGILCFNPRAFGGKGGVFIAGGSLTNHGYLLTTPPTGTYASGAIQVYETFGGDLPASFYLGGGVHGEGHICPHPTLGGWLMFPSASLTTLPLTHQYVYYLPDTPNAGWQKLEYELPWHEGVMPSAAPLGPVVTIEELGIVWSIGQRPANPMTTKRAWIWKP